VPSPLLRDGCRLDPEEATEVMRCCAPGWPP